MTPEEKHREFLWSIIPAIVFSIAVLCWILGMKCGVDGLCRALCHEQGYEEGDGDWHVCTCSTTTTTIETKTIPASEKSRD